MATRRASKNSLTDRKPGRPRLEDRPCDSSRMRKHYEIKSRYGISIDEYDMLLQHQEHRCGACRRHRDEFKRNFAVDHDHGTGLVRGLLCAYCNQRVIGRLKLQWLEGAVEYLRNPPALCVVGERKVPKRKRRH